MIGGVFESRIWGLHMAAWKLRNAVRGVRFLLALAGVSR